MCLFVCVCLFLAFDLPVAFDACARLKRDKHAHHVIYIIYVLFDLILHLYSGVCLREKNEFDLFLHHVCGSSECPQLQMHIPCICISMAVVVRVLD
jgi:hypothetical protein